MSFTGSAQRLWRIGIDAHPALRWCLLVPLLLMAIAMVWSLVLCWYLIFGLWLVPYRLLRRGSRKRKIAARQHREMMAGMQRQSNQSP